MGHRSSKPVYDWRKDVPGYRKISEHPLGYVGAIIPYGDGILVMRLRGMYLSTREREYNYTEDSVWWQYDEKGCYLGWVMQDKTADDVLATWQEYIDKPALPVKYLRCDNDMCAFSVNSEDQQEIWAVPSGAYSAAEDWQSYNPRQSFRGNGRPKAVMHLFVQNIKEIRKLKMDAYASEPHNEHDYYAGIKYDYVYIHYWLRIYDGDRLIAVF